MFYLCTTSKGTPDPAVERHRRQVMPESFPAALSLFVCFLLSFFLLLASKQASRQESKSEQEGKEESRKERSRNI